MPGLGSVAEGMIGTQLDLQNIQLNQAKLAEAPIKLEEERVNLQKEKMQLAQQVKMLSLMQNLKPPEQVNTPDGIADVLDQVAMIQLQSGMPDAAAKMAGQAARIQDSASKTDYRAYRMQNDRLSKFANVLSAVPDSPQGYAQAIQMMMAEDPGVQRDQKFQNLAKQPWKPGLVPMLRSSVLTAKEQAEVTYRKQAGDHAEAAAIVDKHRVALIDEQTKLAAAREKAISKEGGVIVKADDRKAISDQVMRDFILSGADPADVAVRVRPLAEEMKKMMKEQHLTQAEAAKRVYERARSSGVFSGLRVPPVMKGSKLEAPLMPPQKKSGMTLEEWQKSLRQNQWYLIDGVPKLRIGTQWHTQEELSEIDREDADLLDNQGDEE
jgi:hypothetical protein